MKKNYIAPSTWVVSLNLSDSVLADDIGFGNHSYVAEDPLARPTEIIEEDDSYNIGVNLWGDDEEDDY